MKKLLKLKSALPLILLSLVSLSILAISYFRLLDNFELQTLDFRFAMRPEQPVTDKIVLIEIGEDTLKKIGNFPFDRSNHAILIEALSLSGAKAVIFDLFFSEPSKTPDEDRKMEDAMRSSGIVYLPYVFDLDSTNSRDAIAAKGYIARTLDNLQVLTKGEGHINIVPDIDGKYRRVPPYIKYKNGFYPYISLLATCDYLNIPQKDVKLLPGKFLMLRPDIKIPLDDNSLMIINYSGHWGKTYKHYSYVDIVQSYLASMVGQEPAMDLSVFKDKVCVVGLTSAGSVDLHPNPLEPLYPAVGIHAEVFNSILNNRFISRASREANLLILVFACLFILLITLKTKPLKGLFILFLVILVFVIISVLLFNKYGIWIDLFPVIATSMIYLGSMLYKYIVEWKKRLLMEGELDIAKKIQNSFLPKSLPEIEGLNIAAAMFTARQVGGDLYDFVQFEPDRLGVMIGDVSGKGVPASLFMAMVTGAFKFFATAGTKPENVLASLNSKLVKESSSNLFVTMFYLAFDLKKMSVEYSNGGHLPVILLRDKEDGVQFLDVSEGAPLGLMENPYSGKSNVSATAIILPSSDISRPFSLLG